MTKVAKWSFPQLEGSFPSIFPSSMFLEPFTEMLNGLDCYNPSNNSWRLSKTFPLGDVFFEGDNAVVELALAGYSKEDLSIKVLENKLSISAKRCEDEASRGKALARRAFTQDILFNEEYDLDGAEVTFNNGLLRIVAKRVTPEVKQERTLEIK